MTETKEDVSEKSSLPADVTKADIEKKVWLGMGEAIEWIACRGQPVTLEDYNTGIDDAIRALCESLSNLEPEIAERVVEGVLVSEGASEHTPIPHGVWPQTVRGDDYMRGRFALIPLDEFSEFGGMLFSDVKKWDRLRIRSFFVLDRWKPDSPQLASGGQSASSAQALDSRSGAYSEAKVREFLKSVIEKHFFDLVPLTQMQAFEICDLKFPGIPRRTTIEIFKNLDPSYWSVKRGHRRGCRADLFQELIQKIALD